MTESELNAKRILDAAGVFFDPEDDIEPNTLNLNDCYHWATAEAKTVPDADLPRVAELFLRYGCPGVYWWAWVVDGRFSVEFPHRRRQFQYIDKEEELRAAAKSHSGYAYTRIKYEIGDLP